MKTWQWLSLLLLVGVGGGVAHWSYSAIDAKFTGVETLELSVSRITPLETRMSQISSRLSVLEVEAAKAIGAGRSLENSVEKIGTIEDRLEALENAKLGEQLNALKKRVEDLEKK